MDEYKDNNAKGPKGVYIYDRKHSKWSNQPRSGRLSYRNGGEKASDFHRDATGKGCYFHQPQKFVNYDEPEDKIKPRSIPSMYDSDVSERCFGRQLDRDRIDSHDQGLEVAFHHRNRGRVTSFIKQRQEPFDNDEKSCQKYPYVPSPQMHKHCKEYSRHHNSGQFGNYLLSSNLSTVPIQSCTIPLPCITLQITSKENSNQTKNYCYSYQQKRPSTSFGRSDEDDEDSSARYDRVWTPKERYGNWIPLDWSSRKSSDHSANELCSTKTWPTVYHINQHSQPTTNQAARPLNVARRLEHSITEKESVLLANKVGKAGSLGKVQISTIGSQSQTDGYLPPIEVALDYWYRARPEEMLLTRSKKSSNKRGPAQIQEEMVKAEEFANLVQARPGQSKLHRTSRRQEGGNGGRKSTLILEESVSPLTEHHKEEFSDGHHSSRLSKRRSSEPEKNIKVKINGSKRISPHNIRVDLGEATKTSSTHESLLCNSKLQIGGKNIFFIYFGLSLYLLLCHALFCQLDKITLRLTRSCDHLVSCLKFVFIDRPQTFDLHISLHVTSQAATCASHASRVYHEFTQKCQNVPRVCFVSYCFCCITYY